MSSKPNGVVRGRELKVLMLHGYTQSGPLFHAKTRAHEKLLAKAFPPTAVSPLFPSYPGGIKLIYPTAPIRLFPADIPGFSPAAAALEGGEEEEAPEAYAWWRRQTGGERYIGLEEGLQTIADTITKAGGIDGVIGFSQGGAAAAFVASLLEEGREEAFTRHKSSNPDIVDAFSYPESFQRLKTEIGQKPLRFAVSYCGFYAPSSMYRAFYEPKIATPFLHVLGSLDSVVEESRSLGLVNACVDTKKVIYHPGGHFVPIGKDMSGALVGFIREYCKAEEKPGEEEGVEDMDVPF